ncbi:hypothetical protein [Longimicrobium sp.]|uniref:hypothetical protein n=1 Tax=Longimicrobium sp. TaxID=2029185 RepID=UPI002EDBAAB4
MVSQASLLKAGTAVRDALGALVQNALDASKNGLTPFSDERELGKLLGKLVDAGQSLYTAFFTPEPLDISTNQDPGGGNARAAEEWFRTEVDRERGGQVRVHFRVPTALTVPFGLMYSVGRLSKIPVSGAFTFDELQDFWCIKFLAYTTYAHSKPFFNDLTLSRAKTKLFAVFHDQERTNAEYETGLQWIASLPFYTSPDEFSTALKITNGCTRILYFYCHASGNTLSLKANTTDYNLSADRFRAQVFAESRGRKAKVYTILNGCSTATSHDSNAGGLEDEASWLHVTAQEPLRGFIGTETGVPNLFAWRFGLALLRQLLRGVPLDEAMLELRRAHWPLSLLYSLYCYPELRLQSSTTDIFPDFPEGNFSKLPVGVELL